MAKMRESASAAVTVGSAVPLPDEDVMLNIGEVRVLAGGEEKPVNPATIYRWIHAGRWPAPIRLGANTCRWSKRQCLAAIQQMIANPIASPRRRRKSHDVLEGAGGE
jgi:hypothetical protein